MAMRTITLKLHKPGKRKQQIIDEAMVNYSHAYQYLLDKAYTQIEYIKENFTDARGIYKAAIIAKWIDKDISAELNRFCIEPFKDSLKIDFGMTLAGYLNLKKVQDNVSFPIAYLSIPEYEKKYASLVDEAVMGNKPLQDLEKNAAKLFKKYDTVKPVFFCRYAVNRDFCLLYDDMNNKYYAKLYLMNVKSNNRKVIEPNESKQFRYIYKDDKVLESGSRKERYIIVPLSFGQWQEQYLKKALDNPEMLKTARLVKKNSEYFLSVNIDIGEVQKQKTETYMGIARSLDTAICYTIVDGSGRITSNGSVLCGLQLDKSKNTISGNDIHKLANAIVDTAYENKSQVVMQSLVDKGDRLKWEDEYNTVYTPVLNCNNYNKLLDILEYKLTAKGLPPPVKVSPVGIFYTCPICELHSRRNRFSKDMFICTTCGTAMNIHELGSLNLARKLIQYGTGAIKIKIDKTPKGFRFVNKDLELDFLISDPQDYVQEFRQEIDKYIRLFYKDMNNAAKDKSFKKKFSLIRRIEEEKNIENLIRIV